MIRRTSALAAAMRSELKPSRGDVRQVGDGLQRLRRLQDRTSSQAQDTTSLACARNAATRAENGTHLGGEGSLRLNQTASMSLVEQLLRPINTSIWSA